MRKHKDNGLNILQFIFPRRSFWSRCRSFWSRLQSEWKRDFPVGRCHSFMPVIIMAIADVIEAGLAEIGVGTAIVGGTSAGYAAGFYIGTLLVYGALGVGTSLLSTLLTNTGKHTTMSIGGLQICKREAQ